MSVSIAGRADWLTDKHLQRLLAALAQGGEEARVAGGAVRNTLMGQPVADIDIATSCLPEKTIRRAEAEGFKAVPTGIEHGTITVVIASQPFEVTTLREDVETFEEIGLGGDRIEIIGRMPDYVAGSGYRIAPVLGIVQPGFQLSLNAEEVDAAFEVPLRFLMDPVNHKRDSRMWNDLEWFFYDMPYGDRRIWGVTAGIIRTLYERLYA